MKNPLITLVFLSSIFISLSSPVCDVCRTGVKSVDFFVKHILPNKFAAKFVDILCMRKYDSEDLCKKVGDEIAPIAISSMIKKYLNPDHICSQLCGRNYKTYNPENQFQRILDLNQQIETKLDLQNFIERQNYEKQFVDSTINLLHLSDIHLDQHYTQNASIHCSYPICCHPQHGFPQNPAAQASHFGNKNCDCPISLFSSMLESLQNIDSNIDIVIATGDLSAHNEWQKTNQSIIANNQEIQAKIRSSKKLQNSIFVKTSGNNDYSPDHQYNPSGTKLVQVITITDKLGLTKKMVIISLNTIIYDNYNLFLLGDQTFAIFQLMILEQELKNNDNIYLIGHIPPNLDQTAPEYSQVLRALIAKYSDKIRNQFYGHTHLDQLSINTHPADPSQITNFAFIAPSISPLSVGKSKYRIYKINIDEQNSGVVDFSQYMIKNLNVSKAQWIKDYNFRQAYSLKGDKPITKEQINKIVNKILLNQGFSRQEYLRRTGVSKENQLAPFECLILDDPLQRKKCSHHMSHSFSSKLFDLIDLLRGRWGYDIIEGK